PPPPPPPPPPFFFFSRPPPKYKMRCFGRQGNFLKKHSFLVIIAAPPTVVDGWGVNHKPK
ncbi:hypothetical protein, partial [Enterobacter asburiae]